MIRADAAKLRERLKAWFPDREFFMRSQGQVRFIKLSSRVQMAAAGAVAFALLVWAVTMVSVAVSQFISQRDRLAMLEREAKVESAESRVEAYRENLDETADELTRRQEFIEQTLDGVLDDIKVTDKDTVSDSSKEAAETVKKVSAAIPEAAGLAQIEARQIAFAEKLTLYADQRSARAARAIRKLGLNPEAMLRSARAAQGGPLELLSTRRDGGIDPRFERMGLSLARMEALEDSLQGIPQYLPAAAWSISSGFGYRRDPFTGHGAMHAGLDFRAGYGSPIHAAAKGRISFVGQKSGYGRVVEISHGNGLMTRYAHMSAFRARVGQQVAAGDVIGAIGSSGRSTGPHLHFEVRINDRAVNPRPFLEAAPHVLEEVRGTAAARSGKAAR
ncbi:M23 family metallopeptidase [Altererythrobacter fulvus]|uniref:M23 family metallopeptidase n=1 Tax=Caenibius fulvus TaxID=2126012 RepID=UPI00301A1D75